MGLTVRIQCSSLSIYPNENCREQEPANGVLCEVAHRPHEGHPYFKNAMQFYSTCMSNFIYILKKSTASRAPIFTKITTAEQRYVEISCTEFHPN
jgi:hypothetical protein